MTLCTHSLVAQTVSKELATQIAVQYMQNDICNVAPSDFALLTRGDNVDTTFTHAFSLTGNSLLYIVQMPDGWVLAASEYVTTPILASAPTGQFPDTTDMPDGMKWLLSYYEDAMQYTRDSLSLNTDSILYAWEHKYDSIYADNRSVSSLPSSHMIIEIDSLYWNQSGNNSGSTQYCDKIYNKFCPTWYPADSICERTIVGCVAVAMGLVMRYYKWPYSALVPDSVNREGEPTIERHIVTYNWNQMPGSISNVSPVSTVDEIAGFLRDCGYSCRMKYGENSSSAFLSNAMTALNSTFRYTNMTYISKNDYHGNWIEKLKTEIAADRPIIYEGDNGRGHKGHAFVLYGYTNEDKFKINWGWGNSQANNGVYSLSNLALNDSTNYTYHQGAIWGITPNYPSCGNTYYVQQSNVNSDFEIYKGGPIIAQNITINNNRSGVIYSRESVTLGNGFKIEAGSHVIIDIIDKDCDDDRGEISIDEDMPEIHHAPQRQGIFATPSATKILRNGQILILRDGRIYTVTGQEMRGK